MTVQDERKPGSRRAPHEGQPVLAAGEPPERAKAAMILLHGRGGTAEDIMSIAGLLDMDGFLYLAPQAETNAWYPNSFLTPLEGNEPWLSASFAKVSGILDELSQAGIPRERVILLGFSQGSCLASDYACRNPQRYGGLAILSGGLIGPRGTQYHFTGSLEGTPALVACSDVDPHIPLERVKETSRVLSELGAAVDERIYPGMGHTIVEEEIDLVRAMMVELLAEAGKV